MTAQHAMEVGMYSFDCRDAAALANFWAAMLGRQVDAGATAAFAMIGFDEEGPTWMFHQPEGDLPGGENRLMLDLSGGDEWRGEADRGERLGAQRVSEHDQDGIRWIVLRDPEGNTFRIFAPRPG